MLPFRGQVRRSAAAGLLVLALPATALLAACGSGPGTGSKAVSMPPAAQPGPLAKAHRGRSVKPLQFTGTSAAGSCAAIKRGALLAHSPVVLIGTFLPGPADRPGGGGVLLSPARMVVTKYLKGHGPHFVTVETAETKQGDIVAANSEGITPVAGEQWEIFASSPHLPISTTICGGDRPLGGSQGAP